MSDARIRALEKRAAASGDACDVRAWREARDRASPPMLPARVWIDPVEEAAAWAARLAGAWDAWSEEFNIEPGMIVRLRPRDEARPVSVLARELVTRQRVSIERLEAFPRASYTVAYQALRSITADGDVVLRLGSRVRTVDMASISDWTHTTLGIVDPDRVEAP